MARDTAGFTWPPGMENKVQSEGGAQWVGVDGILSIISQTDTFYERQQKNSSPRLEATICQACLRTKRQKNGHKR